MARSLGIGIWTASKAINDMIWDQAKEILAGKHIVVGSEGIDVVYSLSQGLRILLALMMPALPGSPLQCG
jgi:hypothetical protein